jgi:hypothetical protein
MSLRDKKKENTAKRAREAIKRILNGTPTHKELKKRVTVKLNQSTVETEAGLGVSSLRNHGDILVEIEQHNSPDHGVDSKIDYTMTDYFVLNKEKDKLKKNKKSFSNEKKVLTAKNKSQIEEIEELERLNTEIHSHYVQMNCALFDMVPQEQRQDIFEKLKTRGSGNVVPFK